jgi:tetratricopeptide (TPR) repeat protein
MIKSLILISILILGSISLGCISSQQQISVENSSINTQTKSPNTTPAAIQSNSVTVSSTLSPEQVSYEKGLSLYNQKKYQEAIDEFNATISLNKTNGEAYFARGRAFYQIGKIKKYEYSGDEEFEQAISDFGNALHEGINSNITIELLISRGYCNFYLGQNYRNRYTKIGEKSFHFYDEAAIDFSKVLEYSPDNIDALTTRSMANRIVGQGCEEPEYQYNQHKHDLAIIDGQRAIKLAPNNGWAHFAYYMSTSQEDGSTERGISALNEAIRDNPEEAEFYVQRAIRKFKLLDYEGSRIDYEKALELQPRFAMAYQGLGYVEIRQGNDQEALVDMQKALEINPNMAMWWGEFGFTQKLLMDSFTVRGLEEVLKSYDRGIAIDPDDPTIHEYRWDVLLCLNRISEAKEEVRIYKNLEYADQKELKFMEEVTDDPFYNPKVMARYL